MPIVAVSPACSAPAGGGTYCTALFAFGISVSVVDSATGVPAAAGATVIASEGSYADSVVVPSGGSPTIPIGLAGERAGTYTVTVRKSGYKTWTKGDVAVTKDECHVKGVPVTAKIQPAP
ncbi:MAG: carboxypeptidase-like regulatory domain-containing protein [Gemmatimonadota bacterium]|nr:carboxypeptidase-like regulatory domain-containing protein [Gemmatimonadota bacterium]